MPTLRLVRCWATRLEQLRGRDFLGIIPARERTIMLGRFSDQLTVTPCFERAKTRGLRWTFRTNDPAGAPGRARPPKRTSVLAAWFGDQYAPRCGLHSEPSEIGQKPSPGLTPPVAIAMA